MPTNKTDYLARPQEYTATQLDWVGDVVKFHRLFGQPVGDKPELPCWSSELVALRLRLIDEELLELRDAICDRNLEEVADALADLVYVTIGTAVSFGIDLRPVWDEVQLSNMAKVGGIMRDDGKLLKPEGWTPPDIKTALTKGKL